MKKMSKDERCYSPWEVYKEINEVKELIEGNDGIYDRLRNLEVDKVVLPSTNDFEYTKQFLKNKGFLRDDESLFDAAMAMVNELENYRCGN